MSKFTYSKKIFKQVADAYLISGVIGGIIKIIEQAKEYILKVFVPFAFGSIAGLDEISQILQMLEALIGRDCVDTIRQR